MCISSSSHQADEVYTNVYTHIVVFFEPDTNRTKVMLTYQENGREKDYFLLPAIVSLEGLCPPSLRSSSEVYFPRLCRVAASPICTIIGEREEIPMYQCT